MICGIWYMIYDMDMIRAPDAELCACALCMMLVLMLHEIE